MTGHGRPNAALARRPLVLKFLWGLFVCCCALIGSDGLNQTVHAQLKLGTVDIESLAEDELDLRLQIAWGGRTPRLWRGFIQVVDGSLSDMSLMGLDADQPGSFVIRSDEFQGSGDRVLISPRFENSYSGMELRVSGPSNADVIISLTPDLDDSATKSFKIPLRELRNNSTERELGEEHLLRIARSPGDKLRIRTKRDSMVFVPNERIHIDATAHELDAKPGSTLRARFRIRRVEDRRSDVAIWSNLIDEELWTHEELLKVSDTGTTRPMSNIEVSIPPEEGVYNLTIDLIPSLPQVESVASRTLQFVVVDSGRALPLRDVEPVESKLVTEFNPAEPKWYAQLPQWKILPRTERGPWGNQATESWEDDGKRWTRLAEKGWTAYSLHVNDVGSPHVLDIEFPGQLSQEVGISIVEPKTNNHSETVVLNSGVITGDPDLSLKTASASSPNRHRLVFWPKTTSTVVLLTNQSDEGTVAFGRIRVESFRNGLPVEPMAENNLRRPSKRTTLPSIRPIEIQGPVAMRGGKKNSATRKRIAMIDGGQLKKIFLAKTAYNKPTKVSYDDWQTFYEAGVRFVEYLRFAGFDGAAITVYGDGSSLYPSRLTNPTPKFDRGAFASTGQDPYRKDVLELLLRLFDREGLLLIPAVQFDTPLPELEQQLSKIDQTLPGIELIDQFDQAGAELHYSNAFAPGHAPYYNLLDVRVQSAMQHVVEELVKRYAHHDSFGGINLHCLSSGFTQLPDAGWAFDATTLANFHKDLSVNAGGVAMPLTWKETKTQLSKAIQRRQSSKLTEAWLRWRAKRVGAHYRRLAQVVRDGGLENRLYLSLTDLVNTDPWQRHLRPTLPRKATMNEAMLELGLEVSELQSEANLVLLRPRHTLPLTHLGSQAVNIEVQELDIQRAFHAPGNGSLQAVTDSRPLQLELFQQLRETFSMDASSLQQPTRLGYDARRPFARSLAQFDDEIVFEGGSTLPMGQEDIANSFFRVFRQLPAVPFEVVQQPNAAPLVIRTAHTDSETFLYAVNPSPWTVRATLRWKADDATTATLIGSPLLDPPTLRGSQVDVNVEPYGLVAFRIDSASVELDSSQARLPEGLKEQLRLQLDEIRFRADSIEQVRRPAELLRDAGFETALSTAKDAAWVAVQADDGAVAVDSQKRASGNASLRMRATTAPVSVTSHPFKSPETGRLVVTMKLRSARPMKAPIVIGLRSPDSDYQTLHRFEQELTTEFQDVAVRFSDFPTDPNLRLNMHIEMVAPGEVWVDEIKLFDKWLTASEQKFLDKLLYVAYDQHQVGDFTSCYDTITSYWPRFLLRHVDAQVEVASRAQPRPQPRRLPPVNSEKPKFLDRLKKYVPRVPSFKFR